MVQQPKLSICIPTYNRFLYLRELLDQILLQLNDRNLSEIIEIVVSDNNSSDGTKELLLTYFNKGQIKVDFLNKNEGADYNFFNVASKATGEYIWWFCSDDLPASDAFINLIKVLSENKYSIYHIGCNLYSKDMSINYGMHSSWKRFNKDEFVGQNGFIAFGYMLGYLGAIVIKRNLFEQIEDPLQFRGTNYVHVAWIADLMIYKKKELKLIRQCYIKHRLGNDSFLINNNYYDRVMIDIDGFGSIGKNYLGTYKFILFYLRLFRYHIVKCIIKMSIRSPILGMKLLKETLKYFF